MAIRVLGLASRTLRAILAPLIRALSKLLVRAARKPLFFLYSLRLKSHARQLALGIRIKNPFLYLVSGSSVSMGLIIALGILVAVANTQHRGSDSDVMTPRNILSQFVLKSEEIIDEETIPLAGENEYSALSIAKPTLIDAEPLPEDGATPIQQSDDIAFNTGALIKPLLPTTSERRAAPNSTQEYEIKGGDTLGSIAQSFGLKIATIMAANDLGFTSTLRIGQKLVIPPIDGIIYRVRRGDTLQKIANAYSSDIGKILTFNNLRDGDDLGVGQILILPDGMRPTPIRQQEPKKKKTLFAKIKNIFTPDRSEQSLPSRVIGMIWPTTARRITQYFSWRHPAIDIAGPTSNKIYAATDGTVVISGWQRGYGKTLLVSHPNGRKTRYAHASRLLVSAGDRVAKGQVIAMVGNTGRSTGPHLHFELYIGNRRVNPLSYVR